MMFVYAASALLISGDRQTQMVPESKVRLSATTSYQSAVDSQGLAERHEFVSRSLSLITISSYDFYEIA